MVIFIINAKERQSCPRRGGREVALHRPKGQGSPFLFQALLLSPSKQMLVSYQLEWTDSGDPVLNAHRAPNPPRPQPYS